MKHFDPFLRHTPLLAIAISFFCIACAPQQKSTHSRPQPTDTSNTTATSPPTTKDPATPVAAPPTSPALPLAECSDAASLATSFDELSLTYDGEGEFDRNYLTETAAGLVGKHVCLRGWISSTSVRGQKSTSFVLVRHNGKCCFGQGAPPSDNIQVTMDPGGFVTFTESPIQVEGILTLRPWTGPDDLVWSVYHLQASAAKP